MESRAAAAVWGGRRAIGAHRAHPAGRDVGSAEMDVHGICQALVHQIAGIRATARQQCLVFEALHFGAQDAFHARASGGPDRSGDQAKAGMTSEANHSIFAMNSAGAFHENLSEMWLTPRSR